MEYEKETIIPLQKVASEALGRTNQFYKVTYYPKTEKFMSKMSVYFIGVPTRIKKIVCDCGIEHIEESEKIRSTYFLAPDQMLIFIKNLISSYFYFKEKRFGETKIPVSEIRRTWLDHFTKDVREFQLKKWKNGGNKNV